MALSSVEEVVQVLRARPLLRPEQLGRLDEYAAKYPDPTDLVKQLVKFGWLTVYQGRKLLAGHGAELVLGPYVLLDKVGEGGMGKVYKARHTRMARIVALKVVRPDLLSNEKILSRFLREARLAAQLEHPNIVHLIDADKEGKRYFLAMEFVEGEELSSIVKRLGPLPVPQACDYIRQAALGLQHAHDKGLVHRDVKPSNMLVASGGKDGGVLKVLDLGLARVALTSDVPGVTALTQDDVVIGTPDFMSPEQATNSTRVDHRADLYSLGCTFYYLLTAEPLFPKGNAVSKLLAHRNDPRPSIYQFRRDVPEEVAAILYALLQKEPDQRPQSAGAVAAALERWCGSALVDGVPMALPIPPSAPPPDALEPTAIMPKPESPFKFDATPAPTPPTMPRVDAPPRAQRNRGRIFAGIGAGILVVAVMLILLSRNSGTPTQPEPSPGATKTDPKPAAKAEPKPPAKELEPIDKYLPDDTTAVAVLDVRELNKSSFFQKQLRPVLAGPLQELRDAFGIDPTTDLERVTLAVPPEGAGGMSILLEGHNVLTPKLRAWADQAGRKKWEDVGGVQVEVYRFADLAREGEALYGAILNSSPAAVFLSHERHRVVDALKKAAGKTRTDLRDRTVAGVLPRPGGPSPALTFALGRSAKWFDGKSLFESEGIHSLSGWANLTESLEAEWTVEGPGGPVVRGFYTKWETALRAWGRMDDRLKPLADLVDGAKVSMEGKGRPAHIRFHGQLPTDKLRQWFEKLAGDPKVNPKEG